MFLFGKGYCLYCYNKNFKKPIKKISATQEAILKDYKKPRKEFLLKNPLCQARIKCNGSEATDIHHAAGKASRTLYLDETKWFALCRTCHSYIERNPLEAKELGFSITRTNL